MKTAGRENPNRWAARLSNRANGAEGQNRSCKWAAKARNSSGGDIFFLDFPFYRESGMLIFVSPARHIAEHRLDTCYTVYLASGVVKKAVAARLRFARKRNRGKRRR
jgi:hypothetical protein